MSRGESGGKAMRVMFVDDGGEVFQTLDSADAEDCDVIRGIAESLRLQMCGPMAREIEKRLPEEDDSP